MPNTQDANTPDPATESVIDLLALLAYGELSAFDRLAEDARMAPTLAGRAQMAAMAAVELGHYERLAARLTELGVEPTEAMEPFVAPLELFHRLTEPSTWLEGVVKAYVGDGLAADFYREVATFADAPTQELINEVLADAGRSEFAVREVRAALEADPIQAGRLALWARRLVGEAISQAHHVLAQRDVLLRLFIHGVGDISAITRLITKLTERHEVRMAELGLKSSKR